MRSLVWTTTAVVALLGAAGAQEAAAPANAEAGGEVRSAMNAYAAYQNDVSELRTITLRNANDLESVIDRLGRHNRAQLSRGWVTYGAATAAQSPAFVQGVRVRLLRPRRGDLSRDGRSRYARGLRGRGHAHVAGFDHADSPASSIWPSAS